MLLIIFDTHRPALKIHIFKAIILNIMQWLALTRQPQNHSKPLQWWKQWRLIKTDGKGTDGFLRVDGDMEAGYARDIDLNGKFSFL